MDLDLQVQFPDDFIVERSVVPSLDGIREGKGTIYYRCKNQPDSLFLFQGEWESDLLNGPFLLSYNNCIVLEGEYKHNTLYYKNRRCEKGVVLTEDGWKGMGLREQEMAKECEVKTVFPPKRDENAGEVVDEDDNQDEQDENQNEENQDEQDENQNEENQDDQDQDQDQDDDQREEFYSRFDPTYKRIASGFTETTIRTIEDLHPSFYCDIITSLFNCTIPCHFVEYKRSSHKSIWYFYSSSYFVFTHVSRNYPHGRCYLYSYPDLQLLCIGRLDHGILTSVYPPKTRKKRVCRAVDSTDKEEPTNFIPTVTGDHSIGKSYYENGVCSYYGMWRNRKRHGFGIEYDQQGSIVYEGVWIEDKKAVYQDIVKDMNVPVLNLSHYPPITRVMYINDQYYQNHPLVIENYPFLESVFISSQSYCNCSITVKNLPRLRKCVVEEKQWVIKKRIIPFVVRACPRLKEIWLSVSFDNGIVMIKDSQYSDEYSKRFVLSELRLEMNWKEDKKANEEKVSKYMKWGMCEEMKTKQRKTTYRYYRKERGPTSSRVSLIFQFRAYNSINDTEENVLLYSYYPYEGYLDVST